MVAGEGFVVGAIRFCYNRLDGQATAVMRDSWRRV